MNIQMEDLSVSERRVSVDFSHEETGPQLKQTLRTIKKQVRIPGFRPGKAPDSLIINRFREHLEEDMLHEMVKSVLKEIDEEHDLDLLTEPKVEGYTFEEDWSGNLSLTFHVYPTVEMPDLDHRSPSTTSYHRVLQRGPSRKSVTPCSSVRPSICSRLLPSGARAKALTAREPWRTVRVRGTPSHNVGPMPHCRPTELRSAFHPIPSL